MTNSKIFILIAICFSLGIQFLIAQSVKIIFYNTIDSDVDDVEAMTLLHGQVTNSGAVIPGTFYPRSVSTLDEVNTYFDKRQIVIGVMKDFY